MARARTYPRMGYAWFYLFRTKQMRHVVVCYCCCVGLKSPAVERGRRQLQDKKYIRGQTPKLHLSLLLVVSLSIDRRQSELQQKQACAAHAHLVGVVIETFLQPPDPLVVLDPLESFPLRPRLAPRRFLAGAVPAPIGLSTVAMLGGGGGASDRQAGGRRTS